VLKEPQLSQYADRFAAATLIPPKFFLTEVEISGCDLVKLSEDLELQINVFLSRLDNISLTFRLLVSFMNTSLKMALKPMPTLKTLWPRWLLRPLEHGASRNYVAYNPYLLAIVTRKSDPWYVRR